MEGDDISTSSHASNASFSKDKPTQVATETAMLDVLIATNPDGLLDNLLAKLTLSCLNNTNICESFFKRILSNESFQLQLCNTLAADLSNQSEHDEMVIPGDSQSSPRGLEQEELADLFLNELFSSEHVLRIFWNKLTKNKSFSKTAMEPIFANNEFAEAVVNRILDDEQALDFS